MNAATAAVKWHGRYLPRFDAPGVRHTLGLLDQPCHLVRDPAQPGRVGAAAGGATGWHGDYDLLASAPPLPADRLGSARFRQAHGVRYAYQAGAMANGIGSVELVVALARAGCLGSFGAAGLLPERVGRALDRIAAEIPGLPFAANLIHSPAEQALERATVELYLTRGVRCVEASAFMDLTPHVVRYRLSGLRRDRTGRPDPANRLIAKVSRPEVAEKFMRPAPPDLVAGLLADGLITAEQAELGRHVPLAEDITGEADSAGHTDRRPFAAVLPALVRLRAALSRECGYPAEPRIGAAGGIGTPEAAAAAFAAGADYVVTGSVNQSCVEADTAAVTRQMLAEARIDDCAMAPAADMFELGIQVQVLRRGTMFPMRAARLFQLYRDHDSLEALPAAERDRLERQILQRPVAQVWADCEEFFSRRDPGQLDRARDNPKARMALVFRWYLGLSSQWANTGHPGRTADYQVWCGPAMGSFNDWVRGTYLAAPENRRVVDVAHHLLAGAAFQLRLAVLRVLGAQVSAAAGSYRPAPLDADPAQPPGHQASEVNAARAIGA